MGNAFTSHGPTPTRTIAHCHRLVPQRRRTGFRSLSHTTYEGGVTWSGPGSGYGTIFRMSPDGELTTLVSLNGTNGASPASELALASDGSFFGTTRYGGTGTGTVFRVTTTGVFTNLAMFNGTNGAYPSGGLVFGPDGNCCKLCLFSHKLRSKCLCLRPSWHRTRFEHQSNLHLLRRLVSS